MSSPWGSVLFRDRRGLGRSPRAQGGLARYFLVVLLPLVFLPLIFFALLAFQQARNDITRQINNQLGSVASLKETQINQWMTDRATDISNLAQATDLLEAARTQMHMPSATDIRAANEVITQRFDAFLAKNAPFEALLLVNADTGEAIVTSSKRQDLLGYNFLNSTYFVVARQGAIVAPTRYDPLLRADALTTIAGAPLKDPQQGTIAVVFGLLYADQLGALVSPAGPILGTSGRSYAITRDGYELGVPVDAAIAKPTSTAIQTALVNHVNGSGQYLDPNGRRVFGVYRWLPSYEVALLVEQTTVEAYTPITRFANTLSLITLGTVFFSVLVVVIFTRRLTRPIQDLTAGAQRMAAGDFDVQVTIAQQNEIGLLADAFNSMAAQLNDLYTSLEQKVAERTRQLSTASEVARAVTSTLSTDELLTRAVELIRDRFGYYQVAIFLLDESGRYALLQEGTGEVGARLKASGYRLEVGAQSLIGWVTANKKPRIALDVEADALYLKNELLPDTRSEVAIPLRVGDRVVGALDVQSQQANAFNEADVQVLQTLADQIATGVENGRLFARQSQVVKLEQLLSSLTSKIHQTRQIDTILENTATELGRALGARRVVVRLTPTASPDAPGNGHPPAENAAPETPPVRRDGADLLDKL